MTDSDGSARDLSHHEAEADKNKAVRSAAINSRTVGIERRSGMRPEGAETVIRRSSRLWFDFVAVVIGWIFTSKWESPLDGLCSGAPAILLAGCTASTECQQYPKASPQCA